MEIHCEAGRAFRTVALAFTIGAVLGGGVVGYASAEPTGQTEVHATQGDVRAVGDP
ncbi:hypothetical protein [Amycolatopsis lexingtonensis]|uniref:hypothetical protein n=1 Tax=Amycolatopsis lexingtonensis TaxID=218822 RepID=UPI003F6F5E01